MSEIDIYGLFVPVLIIQGILAYGLFSLSNKMIDRLNDHDWILYPNIFYLCWYFVCLLLVHVLYSTIFQ